MYIEGNKGEAPAWCSDEQAWLYRMMSTHYYKTGADYAIPASEISGLMKYGKAASRETEQDVWRAAAQEARGLPTGWYDVGDTSLSADQRFRQLGLIPILAVIDPHSVANN